MLPKELLQNEDILATYSYKTNWNEDYYKFEI
jgi:hypothetical protein